MRDEDFYGAAARELAARQHDEALMAKAYALALGDGEKTKALYIGMRADRLKEEHAVALAAALVKAELRAEREARELKDLEERRKREAKERAEIDAENQRRREKEAAERAAAAWNAADRVWQPVCEEEATRKAPSPQQDFDAKEPGPFDPASIQKAIAAMRQALDTSRWS